MVHSSHPGKSLGTMIKPGSSIKIDNDEVGIHASDKESKDDDDTDRSLFWKEVEFSMS